MDASIETYAEDMLALMHHLEISMPSSAELVEALATVIGFPRAADDFFPAVPWVA